MVAIMESLTFSFPSKPCPRPWPRPFALAGVVSSGNLEAMLETSDTQDRVTFEIRTSAEGFGPVWEAVAYDLASSRPMGGVRVSINDGGAVPAVVSLRVRQALEQTQEKPS